MRGAGCFPAHRIYVSANPRCGRHLSHAALPAQLRGAPSDVINITYKSRAEMRGLHHQQEDSMSLLSRLFGSSKTEGASGNSAHAEDYKGFQILPEPIKEGQQYRVAARISKEVGGVMKTHHLIRADTIASHEDALKTSTAKAKQMIDEQGVGLFG
jgi:hypothetical protein